MIALSDNTPPPVVRGPRVSYQLTPSSTARPEKSARGDRKELRRRAPDVDSSGGPSPVIHVRRYSKASWLTSEGVARKVKKLEAKGIPCMKNWRFITLSLRRQQDEQDPSLPWFEDPLEGYLVGLEHMRRFLEACRVAKLWRKGTPWSWKLEFHEDGFPHWHVPVGHKFKFTHRQLAKIRQLWGLGRTNVKRIKDSAFGYSFKYAFKPALRPSEHGEDDEFERLAPDWFLDYIGKKTVTVKVDGVNQSCQKVETFRRARFWQTSKGFYVNRSDSVKRPDKPQQTCMVPCTVRQGLENDSRTVQVVARRASGKYVASALIRLDKSAENFWDLVGFDVVHGEAVALGVCSYIVATFRLTKNKSELWMLDKIARRNRLKLPGALRMAARGVTLRNC